MIVQTEKSSRFMDVPTYRKLPYINYSACKVFDESRTKFYKEFILKEAVDPKKSYASILGDLIHCLLLNPEDSDAKFARLGASGTPKPQMKKFADNLWEVTKQSMNERGEVSRPMSSLMDEAFNLTAFDRKGERVEFKGKTVEDVIARFPNEAEEYYKSKRDNFGKDVIDAKTYDLAEKCITELKVNPVTKEIVNRKSDSRYQVFKEHVIVFKYQGQTLKALCDLLIVDTKEKKIELFDLKSSGWDMDSFESRIVKNRYYIQWSLYYKAVESWAQENYPDYQIVPMKFIVVSSDMSENPLIYTTSEKDVTSGLEGFTRNGRVHKGLNQIIDEIVWHTSYSIWNMSYTDYQNKGIRTVSLFEEN